jgi:hypothetical protein
MVHPEATVNLFYDQYSNVDMPAAPTRRRHLRAILSPIRLILGPQTEEFVISFDNLYCFSSLTGFDR